MTQTYLMAIDQGTTSTRTIIFDQESNIITSAQEEFKQYYPENGWVEHDPEDIFSTVTGTMRAALNKSGLTADKIASIGITNQRETVVVWEKDSGKPIYNAIVWQDRRTAKICETLKLHNLEETVTKKSGLLIDPYFSATKISWILDNVAGARRKAEVGELLCGTIDSFLIWRLTRGRLHATDVTNAARTNLMNIHTLQWDPELLKIFNVPERILPEIKECCDDYNYTSSAIMERHIPIYGVAGDQQAATIGQACFNIGDVKSTYGTGCFVLSNTGDKPVFSKNRLLTTVAYKINKQVAYAVEGTIFNAGTVIQWLRDALYIIKDADATELYVKKTKSNNGLYIVPAFTGLGAPYWDPHARGAIVGITRDAGYAAFCRAALEAQAYQTYDLLQAMKDDGILIRELSVDGGMVINNWMTQFLSDILNISVNRPKIIETTAVGVSYLAGLGQGIYSSIEDISKHWKLDRRFDPDMSNDIRQSNLSGWKDAIHRTMT